MIDRFSTRSMRRLAVSWAVVLAALISANPLTGQEERDEPLMDELVRVFKKPYLSFGTLVQTVGTFQADRTLPGGNGFSIGTARLRMYGELDKGFGYFFQADFVLSRPIRDAQMYFRLAPALRLDGGLFKVPFSREFLTYGGAIDFVNRARAVGALAPGRQIGLQAGGEAGAGSWTYAVGLFNGNRFVEANVNDNNEFLYAARIAYLPDALQGPGESDRFDVGVNAAYSVDRDVTLIGITDSFEGKRALIGLDARWNRDRWLVAGEWLVAFLEPVGAGSFKPYGWHVTGGYMLAERSQALLRWDRFRPANGVRTADLIIAGFNHWPTRATEVQLNLGVPTEGDLDRSQALINLQLAF